MQKGGQIVKESIFFISFFLKANSLKGEKYGTKKSPYLGKKNTKKGLKRWFDEKWVNQRGEVGYKYKNDVYRPKIRITDDTPITHDELTKKEIETLVSLRVNKIINKMNLVKRDEFDVLKKMVQKMVIENEKLKKNQVKPTVRRKKTTKKKKTVKK